MEPAAKIAKIIAHANGVLTNDAGSQPQEPPVLVAGRKDRTDRAIMGLTSANPKTNSRPTPILLTKIMS
jgi:hypothetical protein